MGVPRTLAASLVALLLGACAAAPTATSFDAPPGDYTRAFEAARDELRDAGFELDRVDARAGVITTRPHASAGFFTPWVADEQTLADDWDGTFNAEQRVVTVRFFPAAPDANNDLREFTGPVTADVAVQVSRLYRPGRTLESSSVRLISQYRDPAMEAQGLQPSVVSPYGQDPALAAALTARIAKRSVSSQ